MHTTVSTHKFTLTHISLQHRVQIKSKDSSGFQLTETSPEEEDLGSEDFKLENQNIKVV